MGIDKMPIVTGRLPFIEYALTDAYSAHIGQQMNVKVVEMRSAQEIYGNKQWPRKR